MKVIFCALIFMTVFQVILSQAVVEESMENEATDMPPEADEPILFPEVEDEEEQNDEDDDDTTEHYDNKFDELPNSKGCGAMKDYKWDDGETKMGEHPWVVLIPCEGKNWRYSYYCSGVLIDNEFVLTAAHCVSAKCKISNVRIGAWNISKTPCDGKDCDGGINVGIKQIIRHPHYNWRYLKNDIALIQLEKPVEFNDKIFPICLPEHDEMHDDKDHHEDDNKYVISGWSKSGPGSLDIKHKVTVNGIKDSECESKYRRYKRMLTSSQFCVAGEEDKDVPCYGDGPVMAMDKSKHWYVSGILSYGAPCGKKGWPDVVTRVSSYKDWIINVCTED